MVSKVFRRRIFSGLWKEFPSLGQGSSATSRIKEIRTTLAWVPFLYICRQHITDFRLLFWNIVRWFRVFVYGDLLFIIFPLHVGDIRHVISHLFANNTHLCFSTANCGWATLFYLLGKDIELRAWTSSFFATAIRFLNQYPLSHPLPGDAVKF